MQRKEVLTTLKVAGGLGAAVVEAFKNLRERKKPVVSSCEYNLPYKLERQKTLLDLPHHTVHTGIKFWNDHRN